MLGCFIDGVIPDSRVISTVKSLRFYLRLDPLLLDQAYEALQEIDVIPSEITVVTSSNDFVESRYIVIRPGYSAEKIAMCLAYEGKRSKEAQKLAAQEAQKLAAQEAQKLAAQEAQKLAAKAKETKTKKSRSKRESTVVSKKVEAVPVPAPAPAPSASPVDDVPAGTGATAPAPAPELIYPKEDNPLYWSDLSDSIKSTLLSGNTKLIMDGSHIPRCQGQFLCSKAVLDEYLRDPIFFGLRAASSGYLQLDSPPIEVSCIYFPQFHRIPENDKFWGTGYTEWSKLKTCQPVYDGQILRQPLALSKGGFGYYYLGPKTIKQQLDVAYTYGIDSFIIYHYWFNGHPVMNRATEEIYRCGESKMKYMLAWANEPWTKKWDGESQNVLLPQDYGDKHSWSKHFQYLRQFLYSGRNVADDTGRPIFIFMRPIMCPVYREIIIEWHRLCEAEGLPKVRVMAMNDNVSIEGLDFTLLEGLVERNPNAVNHNVPPPVQRHTLLNGSDSIFPNSIYNEDIYLENNPDIKTAIENGQLPNGVVHYNRIPEDERLSRTASAYYLDHRERLTSSLRMPRLHRSYHKCFYTGWDNSPRKGFNKPTLTTGYLTANEMFSEFGKFMDHVRLDPNPEPFNILAINAWNEWNEQSTMEPDSVEGYGRLAALAAARMHYYECNTVLVHEAPCGLEYYSYGQRSTFAHDHLHVYLFLHHYHGYEEYTDPVDTVLGAAPNTCLILNINTGLDPNRIIKRYSSYKYVIVQRFPNIGADVYPYIHFMTKHGSSLGKSVVLKLQCKNGRTPESRQYIFNTLTAQAEKVINYLLDQPGSVAIVGAVVYNMNPRSELACIEGLRPLLPPSLLDASNTYNFEFSYYTRSYPDIKLPVKEARSHYTSTGYYEGRVCNIKQPCYAICTMFWARTEIMSKICAAIYSKIGSHLLEDLAMYKHVTGEDGKVGHILERLLCLQAYELNYTTVNIPYVMSAA